MRLSITQPMQKKKGREREQLNKRDCPEARTNRQIDRRRSKKVADNEKQIGRPEGWPGN
jgi:hypothetical protein